MYIVGLGKAAAVTSAAVGGCRVVACVILLVAVAVAVAESAEI